MSYSSSDLSKAAALADASALADLDGRPVTRAGIQVTNAGDGLSAAMAVAPRELHLGDEVTIVLRGPVTKIGFAPIDPKDEDSPLRRNHTIRAESATIANEATTKKVEGALARQQTEIRKAIEAAQGVEPITPVDGETVDFDPPDPTDEDGYTDPGPDGYTDPADGDEGDGPALASV